MHLNRDNIPLDPTTITAALISGFVAILATILKIWDSYKKRQGDKHKEKIDHGDKFIVTLIEDAKNLRTLMVEEDKQQLERDKHNLDIEERLQKALDALIQCANSRLMLIQEKGELLSRIRDLEEALDEYKKRDNASKQGVG